MDGQGGISMKYYVRLIDVIANVLAWQLEYATKSQAIDVFQKMSVGLKDGYAIFLIAEKEVEGEE